MKSPPIYVRAALLWLTAVFVQVACGSVQPAWVAQYNGGLNRGTNRVVALSLDPEDNILVAASSTSAVGDYDYLTLKYAPDGSRLWLARHASLSNVNDQVRDLVVDRGGNVHLTGTSATVKYGSDGALTWTAPFAGRGLALAGDGSLYVTGFSTTDFATVKLTPNGSNEWVNVTDLFKFGYTDRSDKVVVDEAGDVYIAGAGTWACGGRPVICYQRFAVIKHSPSGEILWTSVFPPLSEGLLSAPQIISMATLDQGVCLSVSDLHETFHLARMNSVGAMEWEVSLLPTDVEGLKAMVVSPEGMIHATGARVWNGYPKVGYVTFKLGSGGTELWQAVYHNGSLPGSHRANAIALGGAEDVYVTGYSQNMHGDTDWATIKYTPDGKEQWVIREDGPAHDMDEATAIAVDASGNIYVAGSQTKTNGLIELVLIKYSELTNIQLQADGTALLQFFGTPGQMSRFQASTNLPNWFDLGSRVADTNGIVRFEDTNAPAYPYRFYRLVTP